jgi:hypothetical protein
MFKSIKTAEEIFAEKIQFLSEQIRIERNAKLAKTDWTQVSDAPVDRVAWATYRQALRDITSQEDFPNSVLWPEVPL